LQRLTAGTQEISYVSVLDGTDIVYVARNGTNRAMNTGFVLGARVPGQVTAAGMLLLAMQGEAAVDQWLSSQDLKTFTSYTITNKDRMRLEMVRIRAQGWAISEQQLDMSYRGVAVALRDHKGTLIAALSVSMPMTQESADEAANRVLPLLRETAAAMMNLI
jgi:IclR family pca regulon transcriptional regulator